MSDNGISCWNCLVSNVSASLICLHCQISGRNPRIRFGRYVVRASLGRGQSGEVFKCYDPETSIDVAIKFLHQTVSKDAARREIEALAALRHESIIQILEENLAEHYFVMEFVPGGTLASAIEKDPGKIRDNFERIGLALSNGLAEAHKNRVCHRDLKPENILLRSDGTPVISDFGLAKTQTSNSPLKTGIGTPLYAAPEVWDQASSTRTQTTQYGLIVDIYSLGVVFYNIWTNKEIYPQSGLHHLRNRVAAGNYDPPTKHNPNIPAEIDALMRDMLAPLERRIKSALLVSTRIEAAYRSGPGPSTSLDDHQAMVASIYGQKNAGLAPLEILAHVATNIDGLVGGLLGFDTDYGRQRAKYYFPKALAWVCAFATALDWRLSQLIWFKYPGVCAYCEASPCECDRSTMYPKSPRINEGLLRRVQDSNAAPSPNQKPLQFYLDMFESLYGRENARLGVERVALQLFREVAEATDALLYVEQLVEKNKIDKLHLEVADIAAWLFALANLFRGQLDLDAAFVDAFPGRCFKCGEKLCVCTARDRGDLANWREFET